MEPKILDDVIQKNTKTTVIVHQPNFEGSWMEELKMINYKMLIFLRILNIFKM